MLLHNPAHLLSGNLDRATEETQAENEFKKNIVQCIKARLEKMRIQLTVVAYILDPSHVIGGFASSTNSIQSITAATPLTPSLSSSSLRRR